MISISSTFAPENGRNNRPKNVVLIEIINKSIIVASSWLFIASSVLYTTSCKHSLEFLRMGEIISRKLLI